SLYRSVVVGNPYLDELMTMWLRCDGALERMFSCLTVLQVQAILGMNASGLLAVASRLLSSISEVMQGNLRTKDEAYVCAGLAATCQAYGAAARDTDRRLATVGGHEAYAGALRLWLATERIGSAALKCYLRVRDRPDSWFELASDGDTAGDVI